MTDLTDAFGAHLRGLRQALTLMTPDEQIVVLIDECDGLAGFFLTIANLNELFHTRRQACELSLTLTRPAGHA
jgi:hypothetical protein